MKLKIKALKIILLLLCGAVSIVSCKYSATIKDQVTIKMDLNSDFVHLTGREASDKAWSCDTNQDMKGPMATKEMSLKAGGYELTSSMLVDNANDNNDIILEITITDKATKKVIASTPAKRGMFKNAFEYTQINAEFILEKDADIIISYDWKKKSYMRISNAALVSRYAETIKAKRRAEIMDMFTVPDSEKNLKFEDDKLYYFDLLALTDTLGDSVIGYDMVNLMSTVQGIVNKEKVCLFMNFQSETPFSTAVDKYWLYDLSSRVNFLDKSKIVKVSSPMTILNLLKEKLSGFVVWDQNVPATVNVASTAAGVDNVIPVRYSASKESIYNILVNEMKYLPVKLNLNGKFTGKGKIADTDIESTGSTKNDAYLWAKAKYLDTGKTNKELMAWHVDAFSWSANSLRYDDLQNVMLSNRDYYIAKKAFFWDLNVYPSTIPNDDKSQKEGTDYNTLITLLKKQNELAGNKTFTIGGFTPWWVKYTRSADPTLPEEVATEWQSVKVFSTYNAMIDADAYAYTGMTNASVYMHYPLKEQYKQVSAIPDISKLKVENKNYLMFYMGDYDSSAWLNSAMPYIWRDYNRGQIPLVWPINAVLAERAPHVIDYMYSTQTKNDYFVTGDNGIGYLNPNAYEIPARDKTLNGTLETWIAQCKPLLKKFDLNVSGFLINSPLEMTNKVKKAYEELTPAGIATTSEPSWSVSDSGVPYVSSMDVVADVQSSVNLIASTFSEPTQPNFKMIRMILRSPKHAYEVYKQLQIQHPELKFEVLDPYSFYGLMKKTQ